MVFCCFKSIASSDSVQEASAKVPQQAHDAVADAQTGGSSASQKQVTGIQTAATTVSEQCPARPGSSPQGTSQHTSQDAVMRVVALLQELLGITSERMQVSRIMAILCQRLSVSWACLTALSADGNVFQHIGSAYLSDSSRPGTCSFSSCRTASGLPAAAGARGPPSRTSSTNSIAGGSAVEVGMSDPHRLIGSETSIEAAACSKQPLMLSDTGVLPAAAPPPPAAVGSGGICSTEPTTSCSPHSSAAAPIPSTQPQTHPGAHAASTVPAAPAARVLGRQHSLHPPPGGPDGSTTSATPPAPPQHDSGGDRDRRSAGHEGAAAVPVSAWPLDWQLLHREKSMRALVCLPVTATSGSGAIIGCLSFGSVEPLDWSRQFWAASVRLITGWAAGAITTTRATARATFFARLFGASDLDGLARAFAYDMPAFLADGAVGPGTALPEVRLALVSSRLQHAVVYAAPLLQVSGRLGLSAGQLVQLGALKAGSSGGGGGGHGGLVGHGPLTGPTGAGGVGVLGHSPPGGGGGSGGIPTDCSGGSMVGGLVLGSATCLTAEPALSEHGGGAWGTDALRVGGSGAAAAASCAGAGGGTTTASGYDNLDCLVLGVGVDTDDQMSGFDDSSHSDGAVRRGGNVGSVSEGSRNGAGKETAPEPPPVDCLKISTDSTLLMSVLEAGDIMIIKDALHYFGGSRIVARDLALNNTRPATAGTLVILPLVHRCRSLGCVYVFARNEFNLSFSRAAWGDLAGMLSRAVFTQLVGKLRHEWYSVLSEDPQSQPRQLQGARSGGGAPGGPARGQVRRTATGNSLGSGGSSLRPSFEMPSRSIEQVGVSAGGASGGEAAMADAAKVLEYAGFMLPDGEEGPPSPLMPLHDHPHQQHQLQQELQPQQHNGSGGLSATANRPAMGMGAGGGGEGGVSTVVAAAPSRQRIPSEHVSMTRSTDGSGSASAGGGVGLPCGGSEEAWQADGSAAAAAAGVEVGGGSAVAEPAGTAPHSFSPGSSLPFERCSPSPGSLSFRLPSDVMAAAKGELGAEGATGSSLPAGEDTRGQQADGSSALQRMGCSVSSTVEANGGQQGQVPAAAIAAATGGAASSVPTPSPPPAPPSGLDDRRSSSRGSPAGPTAVGTGNTGTAVGHVGHGPAAAAVRGTDGNGTVVSPMISAASTMNARQMSLDPEVDETGEVSGSSRELQGWPELVDILYDMHRTRNVSVYLAMYRGQAVAVKMMRSLMSMDGRPGHLESEALTIAAQQQLSTVTHPNVLRVLMVYPLVYEVLAGKAVRHPTASAAGSFVMHGAGGGGTTAAAVAAAAAATAAGQAQYGGMSGAGGLPAGFLTLASGPGGAGGGGLDLLQVQAHAMSDLLEGAGAADGGGGGVYLTAVLPRRGKFKRGLALMLELFPSLSLREALTKRMLVPQLDASMGAGGAAFVPAPPFLNLNSQTFSEASYPATTTTSGGPVLSGGLGAPLPPAHLSHAAPSHTYTHTHLQPHALPPLPEVLTAADCTGGGASNVDSSPGFTLTAASNSYGGNAAASGLGSGPGDNPSGIPPMALLLSILTQIAAGMAALHTAGLTHGELRPENVLLALPAGAFSGSTASGPNDFTYGGGGGGSGLTGAVAIGTQVGSGGVMPGGDGGGGGGPMQRVSPSAGPARGSSIAISCNGTGSIAAAGRHSRVPYSGSNGGVVLSGSGGLEVDRSSKPERPLPGRMITPDVLVKVKDAGMTVVAYSKGAQTVRKLLQRNRGAVLPFMPPEVHRGERFGRSADVYMFGILMWELYTGGVAFANLVGTPIKLLQTIIADGVRPSWPDGTPVWYQSLASRCWSGNPKQRPSFRRIADKLAEVAAAISVGPSGGPAGAWAAASGLHGVAEGT